MSSRTYFSSTVLFALLMGSYIFYRTENAELAFISVLFLVASSVVALLGYIPILGVIASYVINQLMFEKFFACYEKILLINVLRLFPFLDSII